MSLPYDSVVEWVASKTLTCSMEAVLAWCRELPIIPAEDAPVWQMLMRLAKSCSSISPPPPKLRDTKQLHLLLQNMLRTAQTDSSVKGTTTPWEIAVMKTTMRQCVDRIGQVKNLWPLECSSSSLTHTMTIWKNERPHNAKKLLQHFLLFSIMVQNALPPCQPKYTKSLVDGHPARLHQLAKTCLKQYGFVNTDMWQSANLAFWLSVVPPTPHLSTPGHPSFQFCGNLAQITGIESDQLGHVPHERIISNTTISTEPTGRKDPFLCAVLSVHATTGMQELLCVQGHSGDICGRVRLPHAVTLVKGVPFVNMAAVVEQYTGRLTFFQWDEAHAMWRTSAQLNLPMGTLDIVSWASMKASPSLLAWAQSADFSQVLQSRGEVVPLRSVHVANWSMDSSSLTVKTVSKSPQMLFDAHFGSDTTSTNPAALFDARQNTSVMWATAGPLLRLQGGRLSACWQRAPHTFVAARVHPAALVSVVGTPDVDGSVVFAPPCVVPVNDTVMCADAAPLAKKL